MQYINAHQQRENERKHYIVSLSATVVIKNMFLPFYPIDYGEIALHRVFQMSPGNYAR